MKNLLLLFICFFTFERMNSQTIIETLNEIEIYNYPYVRKDSDKNLGFTIYYPLADQIPIAKSYKDLDATIIDDDDLGSAFVCINARFRNRDGKYFFHAMGSYTDYSGSDYLILVNSDGTISDYLWVGLFFLSVNTVSPKEFRIDSSGTITVYQINTYYTNGIIDPYDMNITSFLGQRTDRSYQIINGKFELVNTTIYNPIIYKMSDISNENRRIWNGTETPQ